MYVSGRYYVKQITVKHKYMSGHMKLWEHVAMNDLQNITSDKTWIHHYESESKAWKKKHIKSPPKKNIRAQPPDN